MGTRVAEVAEGVYRLTNHVEPISFTFCQYLVTGEDALLFHSGPVQLFDQTLAAITSVVPIERLRWISWGHAENDESGSAERLLAAAPNAEPVLGSVGTMLWMGELAGRPIRTLADGEIVDLGERQVRWVDTPQVPHGWDAGLLFEEVTSTFLCGDLFTLPGGHPDEVDDDLVEPALEFEDAMPGGTALTPTLATSIRALAELNPQCLAPMHAPALRGDCRDSLMRLSEGYRERFELAVARA